MNTFEQFENLNYPDIIELIFEANDAVFLSLPGLDHELAEGLILAKKQKVELDIHVLLDNSEDTIRNGFGDINSADLLLQHNIDITQSDGNFISFIISDSIGYFIFPQSRIFIAGATGTNAFRLDPISIQMIKKFYFPHVMRQNEEIESDTLIDANKHFLEAFSSINAKPISILPVDEFDIDKHYEIKQNLYINPPNPPDLQRKINIYNARIQFCELKFTGINLEYKIVKLPEKALPFNSEALKKLLFTRLKMFQDIQNSIELQNLYDLKLKVEAFRKKFLIPITCRPGKSILHKVRKRRFLEELEILKDEADHLHKTLESLFEKGKQNTKELLTKELNDFFTVNEPPEITILVDPDEKKKALERLVLNLMNSLKFPSANVYLREFGLSILFFDLTWNDFKDIELIWEFQNKGVMDSDDIQQIVEMKKVFDVKR